MDDAIRDNTKELTTLHYETPIWEDTNIAFNPEVERGYAVQLLADSSKIFPPKALRSALTHYGLHSKTAAARADLWEEASTALIEYYGVGGLLSHPVVDADEQLKKAEEKLRNVIERLIEQPKARDKNGGNQSNTTKKSPRVKKPGTVPQV